MAGLGKKWEIALDPGGKGKKDKSFSWRKRGTRIAHGKKKRIFLPTISARGRNGETRLS